MNNPYKIIYELREDIAELSERCREQEADIEELLKEREWISVKDRMPDVHFNVLVYCGGDEYHIARIDKYLRWYVEDGDYQLENEPEMWIQLPEPPESEG